MLTIFFHMTIKADRQQEFHELTKRLTKITREEDEGCLAYIFHQQKDNTAAYVLYEQWRDGESLAAHLAHLRELLGPAEEGGQLPIKFLDYCETTQSVGYDVVA